MRLFLWIKVLGNIWAQWIHLKTRTPECFVCVKDLRDHPTTRRNAWSHAHKKSFTFHFTGWWIRICNFNFNGEYHPLLNNHCFWCFWLCPWCIFHEPFEIKTTLATDHFLQVVHGRCLSLWGLGSFKGWRENPYCFGRLIWNDLRVNVWDQIQLWVWNRRYGIFGKQYFWWETWSCFFVSYFFIFFRFSHDLASHLPIDLPTLTIWQVFSFQGLVEFRIKGPNSLRPQLCERRAGGETLQPLGLGRRLKAKVHALSEFGSGDGMEKRHEFLKFQVL